MQTMLRKISFRDETLPRLTPTGSFDKATEDALKQYQKSRGFAPTGIADYETWQAIAGEYNAIIQSEEILHYPAFSDWRMAIQPEVQHPIISIAQGMFCAISELMPESLERVEVTGINDKKTSDAILWLQECTGGVADGVLDLESWTMLNGIYYLYYSRNGDYLPRPYSAAN